MDFIRAIRWRFIWIAAQKRLREVWAAATGSSTPATIVIDISTDDLMAALNAGNGSTRKLRVEVPSQHQYPSVIYLGASFLAGTIIG